METEFGLKELYDVALKATYPIEIEGTSLESGETIAVFDKIQLAQIHETKKFFSANGGLGNAPLIWWEETQGVSFDLTQGIFSKTQLALMTNSKLITTNNTAVDINYRECLESDEDGIVTFKYNVASNLFVYNYNTGARITNYTVIDAKHINVTTPYLAVAVDYIFQYSNLVTKLTVGKQLIEGFVSLNGKTKIQDDLTGTIKTGIISVPRLKLMSDLSMALGEDATPVVGRIKAMAMPYGSRGDKRVMELTLLDSDIDSDM